MLNDVEFREAQEMAKVDKVKIVACDGKSECHFLRLLMPL
jgi:transcription initiation factor TFIIA small subunit